MDRKSHHFAVFCLGSMITAEITQAIGYFTHEWGCGYEIADGTEYTCTLGGLFYKCDEWTCYREVLDSPALGLATTVLIVDLILMLVACYLAHQQLGADDEFRFTKKLGIVVVTYVITQSFSFGVFIILFTKFYLVGWSAAMFVVSGLVIFGTILAIVGVVLGVLALFLALTILAACGGKDTK